MEEVAPIEVSQARRPGRPRGLDANFYGWIALPALALMVGVTIIPFLAAFGLSLTNYDPLRPDTWGFVGLENFVDLAVDPTTPAVMFATFYMVAGIVVSETVAGLALAVLLTGRSRGIGLVRALFLLPVMTAPIAVALVSRAMLNPSAGWINYGLGLLNLPEPDWLGDPVLAMPSVILADMWTGVPFMAFLFLAGLLAVSPEIKEAAAMDGASGRQVFWFVELPLIQPILIIAILLRTMASFQKFEGVQALTGGGPGLVTQVANLQIYNDAFAYDNMPAAAAFAVVMTFIVFFLLAIGYILIRKARQA